MREREREERAAAAWNMFTEEGIFPIGDGLLDVDAERLKGLLVSHDINEIYEVEQTPFARWVRNRSTKRVFFSASSSVCCDCGCGSKSCQKSENCVCNMSSKRQAQKCLKKVSHQSVVFFCLFPFFCCLKTEIFCAGAAAASLKLVFVFFCAQSDICICVCVQASTSHTQTYANKTQALKNLQWALFCTAVCCGCYYYCSCLCLPFVAFAFAHKNNDNNSYSNTNTTKQLFPFAAFAFADWPLASFCINFAVAVAVHFVRLLVDSLFRP